MQTVNGSSIPVQITAIPEYSLDRVNGSFYIYFYVALPQLGFDTVIINFNEK